MDDLGVSTNPRGLDPLGYLGFRMENVSKSHVGGNSFSICVLLHSIKLIRQNTHDYDRVMMTDPLLGGP